MFDQVAEALQQALDAFIEDGTRCASRKCAFCCGAAGGIAAAAGIPGVIAPDLFDDISDAYEDADVGAMQVIVAELANRRVRGEEEHDGAGWSETRAAEFEAALGEALRSRDAGDGLRYSLMIGFAAGLMFRHQDPEYEPYGQIRDKIIRGYGTGSDELLTQALGTLGFATRITDPSSFASQAEARRSYEAMFERMRRVQNFGLRNARAGNPAVYAQRFLWINYRLAQQGEAAESEGP